MKLLQKDRNFYIFFIVGILLLVCTKLRFVFSFPDTQVYIQMIQSFDGLFDTEPTFWVINKLNSALGGNVQNFFLIYAILAISIKLFAIKKISPYPLFSLYLYICLYFVLQEMIQIRTGVASAFFLLAIPDLVNRNFRNYFFKILLASLFHYSAIIVLLFYFLNSKRLNAIFYFLLPIIGMFLGNLLTEIIYSIYESSPMFIPDYILLKIRMYVIENSFGDHNIIGLYSGFLLMLLFFLLSQHSKIKGSLMILLVKILSIQLFIFFIFNAFPIIAGRLSEFIGITVIILIPLTTNLFKQKLFVSLFFICFSALFFMNSLHNYNLI